MTGQIINCTICGKVALEYCNDLVCRNCHKSLTFEECVDNSWAKNFKNKYLKDDHSRLQ